MRVARATTSLSNVFQNSTTMPPGFPENCPASVPGGRLENLMATLVRGEAGSYLRGACKLHATIGITPNLACNNTHIAWQGASPGSTHAFGRHQSFPECECERSNFDFTSFRGHTQETKAVDREGQRTIPQRQVWPRGFRGHGFSPDLSKC